ncbi:DUF4194 domain-containing protein [Brevibacterium ravenspurgense]|uniref:DUF4194 domain-containing protein n=1 Tax=Brevibacterium ravenspurgense TaxID=479117 RepID=UPI00030E9B29|nr:DUF4194 domain-containing protein [Brevibacterium ravenspurgense]
MRTPEDTAAARSIIALMRGVVYQETAEDVWRDLLKNPAPVRDHFNTIGLDVVVDENEGYAYLRMQEEREGEEPLPRLITRRKLPYNDSLLLVLLRRRLVEFESHGDQGRLAVDRDDIVDSLRVFLADSSDEARIINNIDQSIGRIEKLGFLRKLRGENDVWEVRRILKAYVDAQTLSDFAQKLDEYKSVLNQGGQ